MAKIIVPNSVPARTYHSVTESGAVVRSSSPDKEITIHADQELVGLTDESRKIIDYYKLNDRQEKLIRLREREIQEIASKLYIDSKNPARVFVTGIFQIANVNRNGGKLGFGTEVLLRRMAFSNIISILETFLADHIVHEVENDDYVLSQIGKGYREFREASYKLSDLIEKNMSVRDIAIEKLQNTVFHNLGKISKLYESGLGITFPNFGSLAKAIEIRHDIVHRNGYQLGNPGKQAHEIGFYEVRNLILDVQQFVKDLLMELIDAKNARRGNQLSK